MLEIEIGSHKYNVSKNEETGQIDLNGSQQSADIAEIRPGHFHMIVGGKGYTIEIIEHSDTNPVIKVNGSLYKPSVKTETDLLLDKLGINTKSKKVLKELKAPMPGLVVEYRVAVGDTVKEGDPLVVLEAMKMENILKAPGEAIVKEINAKNGDAIDKNAILITFE